MVSCPRANIYMLLNFSVQRHVIGWKSLISETGKRGIAQFGTIIRLSFILVQNLFYRFEANIESPLSV